MDTSEKNYRILNLLAENEEAVARLYRAYAKKFPRYEAFWTTLAKEEIKHSLWIQKLSARTHPPIHINENRFDEAVFRISLDYLEDKLIQANNDDLSHKEALTNALDIETGMFERGYFNVFEGDDPALIKVLKGLAAETEKHTDSIRNAMAKKRWKRF